MIKAMIVDDDFLVRNYLKSLKSWKNTGYEIVFEARNGEEALEYLEKEEVDFILTDISMPLMNGVDLIRSIREKNNETYIIVLSCHDDFEYVKESMKLGANEYILKNLLDEEKLYDLLNNSKSNIEKHKSNKKKDEYNKRLIKIGSSILKSQYFKGILSGLYDYKQNELKRNEVGILCRFNNSAVINISIRNWNRWKLEHTILEAENYMDMFLSSLISYFDKNIDYDREFIEVVSLEEGCFSCFVDFSNLIKESDMKKRLSTIVSICNDYCKTYDNRYIIAVSDIFTGTDGIRNGYSQCKEIIKLSFYDKSNILYYDENYLSSKEIPSLANEMIEKIDYYTINNQEEIFYECFKAIIQECIDIKLDHKMLINWIKKLDKKLDIIRSMNDYDKFEDIDDIWNELKFYKEHIFSIMKNIPNNVSQPIKKSIEYINENYNKPIGLQDVASYLDLNPAYFSYRFKQEMNIGFSTFILQCRINCAQKLLKKTNFKVKSIALKSGFSDYQYFTKMFKKINGCTPLEYRKNNSFDLGI